MDNDKKMCQLKPGLWDKEKEALRDSVRGALFICARCYRVSGDKKRLCKPKKIDK